MGFKEFFSATPDEQPGRSNREENAKAVSINLVGGSLSGHLFESETGSIFKTIALPGGPSEELFRQFQELLGDHYKGRVTGDAVGNGFELLINVDFKSEEELRDFLKERTG